MELLIVLTAALLISKISIPATAADVANLALKKTATASSAEKPETAADMAIDGNVETRWASEFSDPQWFQIDLGSEQDVGKIIINWELASAKTFKVQTSTDGQNWTDAVDQPSSMGGRQEYSFAPRKARYIKLTGSARTTEYGYSILEFEVFEN